MADMNFYDEKYKNLKILETKRLILREFSISDADDLFEYAVDEEVSKYLTWYPHKSVEQSKEVIAEIFTKRNFIYAIELKEENKVIGTIDLRIDSKNNKASVGYVLSKKYWRKGYMSEALQKIIDISFNELDLNRFEGAHYFENIGSGKVMEKCRMEYEGTFKEESFSKGVYYDTCHYAILKRGYIEND